MLVTGGPGFTGWRTFRAPLGTDVMVAGKRRGITAPHTEPEAGDMPAVFAGSFAARALGRAPIGGPRPGLCTVWPELSEAEK